MPRTVQEIIDEATGRYNPTTKGTGNLLTTDIADFLATLDPQDDKTAKVNEFLNNFAWITADRRLRIIDSLPSYGS